MFMHTIISDLTSKSYVDSYKLTVFLLQNRQVLSHDVQAKHFLSDFMGSSCLCSADLVMSFSFTFWRRCAVMSTPFGRKKFRKPG